VDEPIHVFYDRWKYSYDTYLDAENNELDDRDQANLFLAALNNSVYGQVKADVHNDIIKKNDTPDDLSKMYHYVCRYVVPRKDTKSHYGAAFATLGEEHQRERTKERSNRNKANRGGDKMESLEVKLDKEEKNKPTNNQKPLPEEDKSKRNRKKDLSKIKCWECNAMGHYATDCPERILDGDVSVVGSQHCGILCCGNAFNTELSIFESWEVLLDGQADITVLGLQFIENARKEKNFVRGHGGAKALTHVGQLRGFPSVVAYGAKGVVANVLCQHDVEQDYEIVYDQGVSYTVRLPGYDLVFKKKNKFYVADMREWLSGGPEGLIFTTVRENEARFSKKQVEKARQAQELIMNSGYSSLHDAKALVNDGNITGVNITSKDLEIAHEIYGDVRPYVAGRRSRHKPIHHPVDPELKSNYKLVTMHGDVMYYRDKRFFVCLSMPLGLVTIVPIKKNMTTVVLTEAMETHITTLMSRGFLTSIVHLDPQRGFEPISKKVLGVEIDLSGAGDYNKLIDNRIKHIKEIMRSVFNGLPWKQPEVLDEALGIYAVSRINLRKSSNTGVCPRVAFTGRKPSYQAELSIGYGDYVEGYDPKAKSNAVQIPRTNSLIALYPTGNSTGSWVCYSLTSGKFVRRTNLKKMVTTDLVISQMNSMSQTKEPQQQITFEDSEDEASTGGVMELENEQKAKREEVNDPWSDSNSDSDGETDNEEDGLSNLQADQSDEIQIKENELSVADSDKPSVRTSARVKGGVRKPERYRVFAGSGNSAKMYQSYHTTAKRGIKEHGRPAYVAVVDELLSMLRDKSVLQLIAKENLSGRQRKKMIRSFMFLKTKFDAMGRFEKIKARLVANGKMQDKTLYPDTYSPTVMLQSVMMMLTIAAREGRRVCTLDIGHAYLNAERTEADGEDIIMEIEPYLVSVLKKEAPEVIPYIDKGTGKLYCKLNKAVYGTLDAAKLWYKKITGVLLELGFKANSVDPCVFNKVVNGIQLSVLLYVDDLLVTCELAGPIVDLVEDLKSRFDNDVKYSMGGDMSYLGVHLKVDQGRIELSMKAYVDALIDEYGIVGSAASPAKASLFEIDKGSKLLSETDRKVFHTQVAKLLYLGKRIRVDIMLAVAFLTTRVNVATEEDREKLLRVLKYLNINRDLTLTIKPCDDLGVKGYVDASFCTHESDGKGHTGLIVCVGGVPVLWQSSKQKIVTKDSTESELVGVSDKHLLITQCADFMADQGYGTGSAKVMQDNTSTITLITKGGGKYRNKYLRVRQASVKDQVDSGDLAVEYVPTGRMLADVLSKPLQGTLFRSLVRCILTGHSRATGVRKA
jgi:hypothetical protein